MAKYNKEIVSNDNVEFIHVSLDRNEKKAAKWANDAKLPWLHVLPQNVDSSGLNKFHTENYVPFYTLINKNGKILASGKDESFNKAKELSSK